MRTLIVLAAVLGIALAEGQFYVPRAYYTIDAAGHESIPVPLQRLRRSYNPAPAPAPHPIYPGSWSNSASGANAWSKSGSGSGGWAPPPGDYGDAAPTFGHTYGLSGTFGVGSGLGASPGSGQFVSSSARIGVDSTGQGKYTTSVSSYP